MRQAQLTGKDALLETLGLMCAQRHNNEGFTLLMAKYCRVLALSIKLEAPKPGNFAPAHRISRITKEKLHNFGLASPLAFLHPRSWA
jgi:hypothetical protein